MAAKWLSCTRKKEDIRDFIAVHGKILKTSPVERTNVPSQVSMRQTTMAQPGEDSRCCSSTGSRAPASRFSTGVRRKGAATVAREQESEMKENIDIKISMSPVLSTQYSFGLDDDGQSNCSGRLLATGRPLASSSRQISHSKKAVSAHAPKKATQKARKRLKRSNTNRQQSSSGRQVKVLLSNHCHGPTHSDHNPQPHCPPHKLAKGDTPTLQDRSKRSRIDHDMSTDELQATGHAGRLPHHTLSGNLFTENGGSSDIHAGKDTMENSSGNVSWIDAEVPTEYKLSSAHSSGMNCDTNELLAELSGLEKFA